MRLFEWFFKHCETGFWVFKMLLFLLPTKDDNRANWCDKQLGKWPINDALGLLSRRNQKGGGVAE